MAIQTPTKRCRRCKLDKPIREFQLPRHKLCSLCLSRGVIPRAELIALEQQRAREYALAKSEQRAAMAARGENPWPRPPKKLTADWDNFKNYMVARARQIRADRDAADRAAGKPVKTLNYRSIKYCVRCGFNKPVSQFDNPRDRICLACYNPHP